MQPILCLESRDWKYLISSTNSSQNNIFQFSCISELQNCDTQPSYIIGNRWFWDLGLNLLNTKASNKYAIMPF